MPRGAKTQKPNALKAFQQDPVLWSDKILGGELWEGQKRILRSLAENRYTIVRSCHGVGKTHVAARAVLWFLYCFPKSKVLTLATTWAQVRLQLWSEILSLHAQSKFPLGGEAKTTEITITPSHFAKGLSPMLTTGETDVGVRLQGFHAPEVMVVFDEAPGIRPEFWTAVKGVLTGGMVRFLAIGNPVASSGPFFDAYTNSSLSKGAYDLSIFESPNFVRAGVKSLAELKRIAEQPGNYEPEEIPMPSLATVNWAVDMLRDWGEDNPVFQSRVLGQWPMQSEDSLISLAWLEKTKVWMPAKSDKGPRVLGVDVARFGDDKTVLLGMDHRSQIFKEVIQGKDTRWTSNRIISLIRQSGYKVIVVDDTGLGGGVTDSLREWRRDENWSGAIIAFNGGEAAENKGEVKFANLRAESYWQLREEIKKPHLRLIDAGDLFSQLSAIRYFYTSGGKIGIESKDQMRRRGRKSPDEADALALAVYGIIHSRQAHSIGGSKSTRDDWIIAPELESAKPPWD